MRVLPRGLFDRLRVQMLLVLLGGLMVLDVVMLLGIQALQHRTVDDSLERAEAGVTSLPTSLPVVNVNVVDAFAPSDLYVAFVADDGSVPASSRPTMTADVPDLAAILDDDDLDAGAHARHEAPGGTTYELVRVDLPEGTEVRLQDGRTTTRVDSVVFGYPLKQMERTRNLLVVLLLLADVVVLVLALVLSRWFVGAALRPLRRIGRTADAIATGRTGERIVVDDDDRELRAVASALNSAFDARQEQEDRMRDFVADASHELRTPLASVSGWSDLYLAGGLPDAAAVDDAMRAIHGEAGRMDELVEDMLTLARLDAAPGTAPVAPVVLADLLTDVVDAVSLLHTDHHYDLELPPSDVVVSADRGSLRRAVGNLLVNAGRYTPSGTTVRVRVSATDDVVVRVEDDGPGMSEADRAAAFDRFWRGDRSRSRALPGGSGLGLAISRSVVRAVGGDLVLAEASSGGLAAVVTLRRA